MTTSVAEGFAFFYWHRENARLKPNGMCAFRQFNGYCLIYWNAGHR